MVQHNRTGKFLPVTCLTVTETCLRYILPALAALGSCVAVSCGDGTEADGKRGKDMQAALDAVDDSMAANSPAVPSMLQAGMKAATDSLDYYDWYLRTLRYSVQHDVPDTAAMRWDDAYRFISQRKPTARTKGMMGLLFNTKGSYYYKLHYDPRISIDAYTRAYRMLTGSDSERKLPDVCANLGDAYVSANDMPMAAYWYRRALFLSDSLQLPNKDNVTLYMGLGRIYLNLGGYDEALECYRNAERNLALMPLNMQLYFLNNYGNYYYYIGDYKASEAVFERLKRLIDANGMADSYEMHLYEVNMADICLNLGQYDRAYRLLEPAEKYFTRIGDETAVYYCHTIRMGLAMKAGDTETVRKILAGEHMSTTIDFNIVNIRQRYLREYYVRRGDYKAAYETLSRSVARNDSLKHNIANMRASEIMMRYSQDTLRLHYEMYVQAKDADIRTARLYIYVGVLLIVALVLLLLYGYTFTRKRRLQLWMQLMQLRLLNVRSRISPHFIFNVLNNRMAKADPESSDELMALAKLIRANLNMSGKDFVSLKEELDFVDYYVSVERHSIGDDLSFAIDAPPADVLQGIMVPSMFVQILVENSIKHGLKGMAGHKSLRVAATVDNGVCHITVTDNGPGFDIRRSDPSSTKTGLKVIRNTIAIINHGNKRKIRLDIRNLHAADGSVAGCEARLTIPPGLKPVECK